MGRDVEIRCADSNLPIVPKHHLHKPSILSTIITTAATYRTLPQLCVVISIVHCTEISSAPASMRYRSKVVASTTCVPSSAPESTTPPSAKPLHTTSFRMTVVGSMGNCAGMFVVWSLSGNVIDKEASSALIVSSNDVCAFTTSRLRLSKLNARMSNRSNCGRISPFSAGSGGVYLEPVGRIGFRGSCGL